MFRIFRGPSGDAGVPAAPAHGLGTLNWFKMDLVDAMAAEGAVPAAGSQSHSPDQYQGLELERVTIEPTEPVAHLLPEASIEEGESYMFSLDRATCVRHYAKVLKTLSQHQYVSLCTSCT